MNIGWTDRSRKKVLGFRSPAATAISLRFPLKIYCKWGVTSISWWRQGAEFGLCQRSHRTLVRHGVMPSSVGFREEKGCIWNWVMLRIGCRHADVKVFFSAEFRDLRHVAAHTLGLPYCLHFRFDLVNRCEDKVCSKIQCCDLSLFHCLVALHISCSVLGYSRYLCSVTQSLKHAVESHAEVLFQRTLAVSKVLSKEGRQKMFERLSFTMWSPVKLQAVQWLWVMWYCCWELITWVVHSHQLWYCGTPRCCWWIMCNFVDQIHRHGAKFFWGTHDIRSSWLKHRRFSIVFSCFFQEYEQIDQSENLSFLILSAKAKLPHVVFCPPPPRFIRARNAGVAKAFSIQWYATWDSAVVNRLSGNWTHLFGSTAFLLVTLHEVPCEKILKNTKPQGLLLHILEGCVRDGRAHFEVNQSLFSTTMSCACLVWSLLLPP